MDNPIISSFIQSGLLGKGILILLFGLSVYVWTIIQSKYLLFKQIQYGNGLFLEAFSKLGHNFFGELDSEEEFDHLPAYQLWFQAKSELTIVMEEERGVDTSDVEAIAISLSKIVSQARLEFDNDSDILGTITSIAPFLGLLGTVWGVMSAFQGMGKLGNASIAAVAPGLSESLVTTAVGLIVAIPAAVCFNYAKTHTKRQVAFLNNFSLDILSSIEKQFVTKSGIKK